MEEAIAARLEPSGMGPLKAVTCTFCVAGELHSSPRLSPLLEACQPATLNTQSFAISWLGTSGAEASSLAFSYGCHCLHGLQCSASKQEAASRSVRHVPAGDAAFLANDIRVKKGLDSLGCLGDMGWYCVRASLWAYNFEKPVSVSAHAGGLHACTASLNRVPHCLAYQVL